MTNTVPPNGAAPRRAQRSRPAAGGESRVGLRRRKRTPTDIGLALITPIVGQEFLDRHHLRDPLNRALRYGIKRAFSVAGASTRQFKRVQGLRSGATRLKSSGKDYFDLTPDDEQKMIVDTVSEFADEVLRPAAREADDAATYPAKLISKAAELVSRRSTSRKTSRASPRTAPR